MGLLDKAKEKKQEEGEAAPEPEVKESETTDTETKKIPLKKKVVKKKVVKSPGKKKLAKKPGMKKPSLGKKKPMKKKAPKPKKEKAPPAEPFIEGLPENLEFASVTSRIVAQVIDGIILFVILAFIGIILLVTIEDLGLWITLGLYFLLPIVYFMTMEGKDGQTVGKGMAHVKIISLDGRPLTPSRVMKSAIAKGLLYPILNILDAVFGVFIQHTDTRQRYTQYETDLIAIVVEKKKVKFGEYDDEEEGESEEGEEPEGADEDVSDGESDAPADDVSEEST